MMIGDPVTLAVPAQFSLNWLYCPGMRSHTSNQTDNSVHRQKNNNLPTKKQQSAHFPLYFTALMCYSFLVLLKAAMRCLQPCGINKRKDMNREYETEI